MFYILYYIYRNSLISLTLDSLKLLITTMYDYLTFDLNRLPLSLDYNLKANITEVIELIILATKPTEAKTALIIMKQIDCKEVFFLN